MIKKFKKKQTKYEAIQIPSSGVAFSGEVLDWLHKMKDVAWKIQDNRVIFYEDEKEIIANSGSWIVKDYNQMYNIYNSETFVELFKPTKNKL